jgi:hypothetical protein
MGTPAEFCENAHNCIDLAKNTDNAIHRQMLLGLAIKWFKLAGITRRETELLKGDKQSAA